MEFLIAFDRGVFFAIDNQLLPRLGDSGWTQIMVFFTSVGDLWELRIFLAVAVIALAVSRRLKAAIILLAVFLAAHGLNNGVKTLVARPRPHPVNAVINVPSSYSYPSGHALESTALYVSFAFLAAPLLTRRSLRVLMIGASLLLVFLIGVSRVYFCVHFVTDVIGGWAAGMALALAAAWLDQRLSPVRSPDPLAP
jgi:undecaprenyl-diphosphatase